MFRRILMPSDGSSYALHAAEYAADIAEKYKAKVTLLYVVELPPVLGLGGRDELQERMRQDLSRRGQEALDRTRQAFEKLGVQPDEELLFGSAVVSIIRHARDGEYDLMVIGSRGAGTAAVEQILIGSVAEGILHGAPCPVLIVRPSIPRAE
jgi:nucleotide-binding universal stress UspA family protein